MTAPNVIHTLTTATESGSYYHTVSFRPLDSASVEVREWMRDDLAGNWMGAHGAPRVLPIKQARAYYRGCRRFGYA